MGKNKTTDEKKNIESVYKYFDQEKTNLSAAVANGELDKCKIPVPYNQVRKRTADALNVSLKAVDRVKSEVKNGGVSSPKHQRKGRKRIELDSFCEGVLRRITMKMYADKEFPTLDSLHKKIQDDESFPMMSKTTLWRRLKHQLKFKYGRFDGKPVLLERHYSDSTSSSESDTESESSEEAS